MLELGPGLGQELEYFRAKGVPTDKCYAIDERFELWNLGRQLFGKGRDDSGNGLDVHFINANLIRSSWADEFKKQYGQVDIIIANHFFDSMSDALAAAVRRWIRPLLKPGTLIIGYQIGSEEFIERDDICYNNKLSWLGSWQAVRSEHQERDIQLELEVYEKVDLTRWGAKSSEWDHWLGPQDLHGVFFAVRRTG